jgi:NAD(P)-dependent dehydrogenase (short-subunit alcohol dehydrogenase family)
MELRGKRVLITGGAAGLGAATAAALAAKSCKLTLLDLDAAAGEATVRVLRVRAGCVLRVGGARCVARGGVTPACSAAPACVGDLSTLAPPRTLTRRWLPTRCCCFPSARRLPRCAPAAPRLSSCAAT